MLMGRHLAAAVMAALGVEAACLALWLGLSDEPPDDDGPGATTTRRRPNSPRPTGTGTRSTVRAGPGTGLAPASSATPCSAIVRNSGTLPDVPSVPNTLVSEQVFATLLEALLSGRYARGREAADASGRWRPTSA